MIWLRDFIPGFANNQAIPMAEKKAATSATSAHLTRKRISESMGEMMMSAY